jgi:hypothetical protein
LFVAGFPESVALCAQVYVFHIGVVVSQIDDFRLCIGFIVGGAFLIWTFHVLYAGECRIEFGVFVDYVIELLFLRFIMTFQNNLTFGVGDRFIRSTLTTKVG